ncbi:MAG: class I SAM-dependent methyltransferase [Myxococcales bacterium]|nr:class I SAM-dependent methyltransferase [Myxococcales bacterium]
MAGTLTLSPADAAVIETFVVPRYLGLFGELAQEMLLAGGPIRLAHIACRTGYPDRQIVERLPGSVVVGIDANEPAIELARNKAATLAEGTLDYRVATTFPTELNDGEFSHSLLLHPTATPHQRQMLFHELSRVLYSGGQALVALPLRGSFVEVDDLFREYALKSDQGDFGKRVESSGEARPSLESLEEELEAVGLYDVDIEVRQTHLGFDSGRAFAEDPVTRLMLVPEFEAMLELDQLSAPLRYVYDAIDKYWSEAKFELTLNIGCASARKP